jgi:neutral ceramidase
VLQFKREFGVERAWVAGYSNDMFGYLPTRRVQQEGGYEAGRAALWSALPMPVAESSEARIFAAVRKLTQARPIAR